MDAQNSHSMKGSITVKIGYREAYGRTLDAVAELQAAGVEVSLTLDAFNKAQPDAPLPLRKVVIIECSPKSTKEVLIVAKAADECGWSEISFTIDPASRRRDGGPWPMVFGVGFFFQ